MKALFSAIFLFLMLTPCTRAEEVKVGAYINDIQNFDLNSHSYTIDAYIWFKWRDRSINPSLSFEFMNPAELWGHSLKPTYESPIQLPNGEYYQVIRIQGKFSKKFDLKNYPFDKQNLVLEFEDSESETSETRYVVDPVSPIAMNPDILFPGFILGKPLMSIEQKLHPSKFGDPRQGQTATTYTRAKIEIPIKRPVFTYLIKLVLPIFCVVLSACLMFGFNPSYVDARVGIGITSLLTVVALQITLNDRLPEIDYLVLMDKIYLATYLFVVTALAVIVNGSWMAEKGQHMLNKVIKLDRMALIGLITTYIVMIAIMLSLSIYE